MEDPGSAVSTKLGLLRDGWKENRHGRMVGTPEALEATFQRTEKGSRRIRTSHTHTRTQALYPASKLRPHAHGPSHLASPPTCPCARALPGGCRGSICHSDPIETPIYSPFPPPNSKEQGFAVKTEDFKDAEMQSQIRGWGRRDSLSRSQTLHHFSCPLSSVKVSLSLLGPVSPCCAALPLHISLPRDAHLHENGH